MNTSLNHLSPYKIHQLQILTKMIVRKTRPEKIVLFGLHASTDGGLDFSTDTSHPAFFASFDLLVISKRGERRYDYEVQDVVENHARVETPVNIVVHDIDYVNSQLEVGHYFFTMLAKDAILLYDAGQVELKEAATPDLISIKDAAQKDFGRWTRSAIGFYRAAQFSQQGKEWRIAVFLLHQAAEHTYQAILLTFSGYKPCTHNLDKLRRYTDRFSIELARLFPRNSPEENSLFKLLLDAYVNARYQEGYLITESELNILMRRVEKLQDIANRICRNRITSLKKMAMAEH